jgi:short-subunit dehydrogenase
MFDKNKRAIVVGASRGIGLGLVRELLNQHWHVIATIRDINQVSTGLNQLLSEYPDRLELTELDLIMYKRQTVYSVNIMKNPSIYCWFLRVFLGQNINALSSARPMRLPICFG